MRFKVGSTDEEISLDNVRVLDKGSLKMAFTLVKHKPTGPKVTKFTDCKLFEVGGKCWFNLPQKEVVKAGSDKKDYFPLVVFEDKEYVDQLKVAVMQAVEAHRKGGNDQRNSLQSSAPFSF